MTKKTQGDKVDKLTKYSLQIAMLGQLLAQGLINSKEYQRAKSDLMRDYSIKSDLTAQRVLLLRTKGAIMGTHYNNSKENEK